MAACMCAIKRPGFHENILNGAQRKEGESGRVGKRRMEVGLNSRSLGGAGPS